MKVIFLLIAAAIVAPAVFADAGKNAQATIAVGKVSTYPIHGSAKVYGLRSGLKKVGKFVKKHATKKNIKTAIKVGKAAYKAYKGARVYGLRSGLKKVGKFVKKHATKKNIKTAIKVGKAAYKAYKSGY